MAPIIATILGLHLCLLHFSHTQTIIGYSPSFSSMNLPSSSSPESSKQAFQFWPSLPPRSRSDVPIRVITRDRLSTMNAVAQLPDRSSLTQPSSTLNPGRQSPSTQPMAPRARTDTARLAFWQALRREEGAAKAPPPSLTVGLSQTMSARLRDEVTTAGTIGNRAIKQSENGNSQGFGSGQAPTSAVGEEDLTSVVPTVGNGMAQYQPQAQTMIAKVTDVKTLMPQPNMFVQTSPTTSTASATFQSKDNGTPLLTVTQQVPKTVKLTGNLASKNPSGEQLHPNQDAATSTTTHATINSHAKAAGNKNSTALDSNASKTDPNNTNLTIAGAMQGAAETSSKTTQHGKPADPERNAPNTTAQSSKTGTSPLRASSLVPTARSRFSTTYQAGVVHKNRSIFLGHPQQAPYSTYNPALSPTANSSPSGALLYWGDLSRTLAFAWELHVYGSATLFLLLMAGAALGLTLSPGSNCPDRGALALANVLLFLVGGLRVAFFFTDPYGTRNFLSRPTIAALYNLPLHLLVWAQASLALLAIKAAGVSVLPLTMEQPPLIAVLTVLHCTLTLGVDLLSSALSPVVPVTLQVLSLCWGLAICLGFLCYVFPRIRCAPMPLHGMPDEARRKTWTGSQRTGLILAKVLAVCAVLGGLCCGLHVHATFWLYGLLGNWTSFNWGWWLVHFWARLLELGWGFALLLLGSWVFWRPVGCRRRGEGGQDSRPAGDTQTPSISAGSPQRHTCWTKIVQSLRGKPCKKSESNGVGAGGDIPNNWAGQEHVGADISKSLIRNQNHEERDVRLPCIKNGNRAADQTATGGPSGSLMVMQALDRPLQRSVSGSLDQDRDTSMSFCEFDLRPPSPINLTRSIDEALHREHLLEGGSLFYPFYQPSPSPRSAYSQAPWQRRNSDPQMLSESSDAPTESSMPLGGSILSSVPSRQVTAPPTPSHPDNRWTESAVLNVPSSISCPVSLRPCRTSTGHLVDEDTRPFVTPSSEQVQEKSVRSVGSRSYLEVSRHDESASVSSEVIDL